MTNWWGNSQRCAVTFEKQYLQHSGLGGFPGTSTQQVNKTSMYNTVHDFATVNPKSPQTKVVEYIKNENHCRILRQDLSTQKLVQW